MTIDIEILQFLHYHPLANRAEIMAGLTKAPSDSTMKRLLSAAVKEGNIETAGRGPATKYKLTPQAHVTMPLDLATYFDKDIDEREVQESFNFDLIRDVLPKVEIFTKEELEVLEEEEEVESIPKKDVSLKEIDDKIMTIDDFLDDFNMEN